MLRLFNSILKFGFAPRHKLVSLAHLAKKTAVNSIHNDQPHKSTNPNDSQSSSPNIQRKDAIGLAEVQRAINAKSEDLSREELQINHIIKIQTKASNLYYLHKQRRMAMSTRNMVNLLIKVLQLRRINQNQSEQTQKFDKMMQSISSKLNKFTPEDMIRFLFCLKSVKMLGKDIQRINPFIMAILQEFSQRNRVGDNGKDQIYSSFEVISLDSNLKLLHSLCHLHMISGREFQPVIDNLIKMIVTYFHSLVQQFMRKKDPKLPISRMRIIFYFGLIRTAGKYTMSVGVVTDFIKMVTSLTKFPINNPALYLQLANHLHRMPVIMKARQQSNLKQHSELFSIYTTILNQLQKPQQILKLSSKHLLKLIQNIDSFTEQQLQLLQFKEIKQKTLQRILAFTLKIYQRYWNKDYLTLFEKSTIESWVYNAAKQNRQFLCSILITYHQFIVEKKVTCINEFNKLMNLCFESFSDQSFCTKAAVVYIGLQRESKNIKNIVDMFLTMEVTEPKDKKEFKQIKYFKKHQALELYISLFSHWRRITQISRFTFDAYREGTFIKILLRSVIYLQDISGFAELMAKRMIVEPSFYEVFLKKYKRVSEENRTLSRQNLILVQEQQFKNEIENSKMLQNQRKDTQKLNPFYTLKYNLRQKIKRCLVMFKFAIEIFQHFNRAHKKYDNILQAEQFKVILQCFDDDIRCLFFKELFTAQIFGLVSEIWAYLQSRGGLKGDWKINDVWKWMKNEKIEVIIQNGKGLLGEFGQRGKVSNIIGGIKAQEDQDQDEIVDNEIEKQEQH